MKGLERRDERLCCVVVPANKILINGSCSLSTMCYVHKYVSNAKEGIWCSEKKTRCKCYCCITCRDVFGSDRRRLYICIYFRKFILSKSLAKKKVWFNVYSRIEIELRVVKTSSHIASTFPFPSSHTTLIQAAVSLFPPNSPVNHSKKPWPLSPVGFSPPVGMPGNSGCWVG